MTKKINLLLFIALIVISTEACKKDNKPKTPPGNVKIMTGQLTAADGLYQGETFLADQERFDENGKLISAIKGSITTNLPIDFHPIYYFYQDGRLAETKDEGYTRVAYTYDQNGRLSEVNTYYGDYYLDKTLKNKQVHEYNNQGQRIKTTYFNYIPSIGRNPQPPSKEGTVTTFENNIDGTLAKEHLSDGTTRLYEYDSHRNKTRVTLNTTVEETYAYQYDASGKITEIRFSPNTYLKESFKLTIAYDEFGQVMQKKVYRDHNTSYSEMSTINYTYTYF